MSVVTTTTALRACLCVCVYLRCFHPIYAGRQSTPFGIQSALLFNIVAHTVLIIKLPK